MAALERGFTPVPVFVWTPDDGTGAASRRWLHEALGDLDAQLRALGSRLTVRVGEPREVLAGLISETGAKAVYWQERHEPLPAARDAALAAEWKRGGVAAEAFEGDCLFRPGTVLNKAGGPFRVFTPFWRHCCELPVGAPLPAPASLPAPSAWPRSESVESLGLKPRIGWDAGLTAAWDMTRAGALSRLKGFAEGGAISKYAGARDLPAVDGTSRLSPYLHFGQLSVREAYAAARRSGGEGRTRFLAELGWREFARHLLFSFPEMPRRPLDPSFERFSWADNPELAEAWRRGRTGMPLVDAGMRQLWETGWMHNRVRMVVGSFLVKNLLTDWRVGAAWFMDTLVDADMAQNTAGWQWVAGCGADAAPYFRVFNPVLQGEKFDPEGDYVRRFVPELARLPARWIHRPWEAPEAVLGAAGVRLGENYPAPVVSPALSRARALEAYARMRR